MICDCMFGLWSITTHIINIFQVSFNSTSICMYDLIIAEVEKITMHETATKMLFFYFIKLSWNWGNECSFYEWKCKFRKGLSNAFYTSIMMPSARYILGQWTAIYDGHCYICLFSYNVTNELLPFFSVLNFRIIWCRLMMKIHLFLKGNEICIQNMKIYFIFTSGPLLNVYFYVLHKTENAKFSDFKNNIFFFKCHIEFCVSVEKNSYKNIFLKG